LEQQYNKASVAVDEDTKNLKGEKWSEDMTNMAGATAEMANQASRAAIGQAASAVG